MSLLIVLTALAAFTEATDDHRGLRTQVSTYSKCTAAQTKLFLDNLSAASNGCMVSTSYVWDGTAKPTDPQRAAMCQCTVNPFNVSKCYWTKLGQYDIDTSVHFGFVYNCLSISGKATPKVTEIDATAAVTTAPTPTTVAPKTTTIAPSRTTATPSSTPSAAASESSTETSLECTVRQLNAFTGALNTASNGCTTNSTYNWGGNANPTNAQYSEICKCATVTAFTIPACYIQKGQSRVSLTEHYNWVTSVQCPSVAPASLGTAEKSTSSKVGLVVGISGIIVAIAAVVILAILLYKRKRDRDDKAEQQQYQRHNDTDAVRSPRRHEPRVTSPPHNNNRVLV